MPAVQAKKEEGRWQAEEKEEGRRKEEARTVDESGESRDQRVVGCRSSQEIYVHVTRGPGWLQHRLRSR